MMQARFIAIAAALGSLPCAGCATLQDVVAYGQGPFDHSPASTSTAALDGLHESSWGNSGKWAAQEPEAGAQADPEPAEPDPPPPPGS